MCIRLESVEAVVRNFNRELKIQGDNGVFTVYLMLEMLEKEKILPAKALKKRSQSEKQTGPVL